MKITVKRQYQELVEYLLFPVVVYIYETGRIVAKNSMAKKIIGEQCSNINTIWKEDKKLRLPKEILENGTILFFQKEIKEKKNYKKIDMELNVFPLDRQHLVICFFEESYKHRFVKHLSSFVPRFFRQDKKGRYLGMSYLMKADLGCKQRTEDLRAEELFSTETCAMLEVKNQEIADKKVLSRPSIEEFWKATGGSYLVEINRMAVLNRNGTYEGILGMYTPILKKQEYHHLFDMVLAEKDLLAEGLVCHGNIMILWKEEEGWPIEYVTSNFLQFGYSLDSIYQKEVLWKDIVYEEDYPVIRQNALEDRGNGEEYLVQRYRIQTAKGKLVWVQSEARRVVIDEKAVYRQGVLKILDEGNKEKKSFSKLVSKEEMLQEEVSFVKQMGKRKITAMKSFEVYLKNAIAKDCIEFEVYYQPIVDSERSKVISAEALVRWKSPELGTVSPTQFISVTEYLGLIVPLGDYVLKEAFTACKKWNDELEEEFLVHVNLSVMQLVQPDILERIMKLVRKTKVNPKRIVLEVTESLAIEDIHLMTKVLLKLKEQGFQIALDDFGTGYSSLNHMMEIPLDYVKIDKSFIEYYGTDKFNPSLFTAIAELAHSVDVKLVVEGVETRQQVEFLAFLEIEQYQGFFYGKPVPFKDFEENYLVTNEQNGGKHGRIF